MGLLNVTSKEVIPAFYWEGSQDDEAVLKWINEHRTDHSFIDCEIKDGVVYEFNKEYKGSWILVDLNKTPYLVPFVYGDDEVKSCTAYSVLEMNVCYDFVKEEV